MKLIFIADPMCSWCYGFGKELSALMDSNPTIRMKIVVGGVRAGATDVLDDSGKQFRLSHWERVEAVSGVQFNRNAFAARQGFVYDTEPVCRAVVAARILAPEMNLLVIFRALQHAFYVDGLDTTNGSVLAEVGAAALTKMGRITTAEDFLSTWRTESTIAETRNDFALARSWGISSFPALLLEKNAELQMISPGYTKVEQLQIKLAALLEKRNA